MGLQAGCFLQILAFLATLLVSQRLGLFVQGGLGLRVGLCWTLSCLLLGLSLLLEKVDPEDAEQGLQEGCTLARPGLTVQSLAFLHAFFVLAVLFEPNQQRPFLLLINSLSPNLLLDYPPGHSRVRLRVFLLPQSSSFEGKPNY